jgi:hypothetical protein
MSEKEKPGADYSGSGPVEFNPEAPARRSLIEQLLTREEQRLLAIPGVVSVGIAVGGPGRPALAVGVTDAGVAAHLPGEIDGVPLIVSVTGPIEAQLER